MATVIVVDHDPGWAAAFERLRDRVWPAVSDVAVAIEHVGSTSVAGLAAKPILDVDVIVPPDQVSAGIERLERIGYRHRGDLGVAGREAFHPPDHAECRHNLYLCRAGCPSLANHLAIRDHLRANPDAVVEYGALKKRLADEYPDDIDGYIEGKTAFLVGILRKAGFDDTTLDEITDVNRRPAPTSPSTACRVEWLTLPAPDLAAARTFYETVFGFVVTEWREGFWTFRAGNLGGGLDRDLPVARSGIGFSITVDAIEPTLAAIVAAGGEVVRPGESLGPGNGFFARFRDPNGNLLELYAKELAAPSATGSPVTPAPAAPATVPDPTRPVHRDRNADAYRWGNGCEGWHLARTDALSVIQERVPPGRSEVRHRHERAEQFFFVLRGSAALEVDGNVTELGPEEGRHVPAGVPHRLWNASDADVEFLVISTPPSHGDRRTVPEGD